MLNRTVTDRDIIRTTIAQTRMFAGWPAAALDRMSAASSLRRYRAGEVLLRRGEPTPGAWLIASGCLSNSRQMADGRYNLADLMIAGQITGFIPVIDGMPAAFDTTARTDAEVVLIPGAVLLEVLREDSGRLLDVARMMCRRTRLDYEAIQSFALDPLRMRILKWLCFMARGSSVPGAFELPVGVTQDDLAAHFGVSRQSVNKEIAALVEEGVLAHRYRSLVVTDMNRMVGMVMDYDPVLDEILALIFGRPARVLRTSD
ncbi:MAG TPA: Crp/Fnr family transcriptional regulator [Rhizomicrobium sp.]|nr:Crp/Fnr family transcriptional regulator [Rhizomicrobium sp.]